MREKCHVLACLSIGHVEAQQQRTALDLWRVLFSTGSLCVRELHLPASQLHPGEAADRWVHWPPLLTTLLLPVRRRAVTRPVPLPHSERLTRDARST